MRDGYKMTELGEIPENWKIKIVKDVTVWHKQGFYTKNSYDKEGTRLVRITDLGNPKVDFSDMPFLKISDKDYKDFKIELGDFLFARSGAIGRYGIVENLEYPAVFASYLINFRFDNQKILNRFFGYFFESVLSIKQLKGITQGNANVNINAENIKSLKLPLPPFSEQHKIVAILSTVDEKIEIIDAQITQTRELKKGLMQKLLTRGIGHTKFKDSVLGEIPESWEVIKLGMVVDFFNGKGHEQCINENGYYIVVNSKFVSTDGKVKKYSDQNLCPLQENDIAMVMSDVPNGKAIAKCFIVTKNDKYTLNQRICCLRTTKGDYKFLYYVINRNEYYLSMDNGVSQTNFRKEEVLNCPIPFVPFAEQKQIAWILTTVDDKLEVLHKKKESYQELKKGLMQQLLTGKVRVFQTELEIS